MNKKQVVCMWVGIAAIVIVGLSNLIQLYVPKYDRFCLWVFLVTLVTAGLILTFKDRETPEGEARKPMNVERGLSRLTLVLSVIISLVCFSLAIVAFLYEFQDDAELFCIGGLFSFAGIWILYGIILWVIIPISRWVAKGFHVDTGQVRNNRSLHIFSVQLGCGDVQETLRSFVGREK